MASQLWNQFATDNLPLFEEMYAAFLKNPSSVSTMWRQVFQEMEEGGVIEQPVELPQQVFVPSGPDDLRVDHLIHSYRVYGHLMAHVNPLEGEAPRRPRELLLQNLGFQEEERGKVFPTCGLLPEGEAPLQEILDVLESIYCQRIGIEYIDIHSPELEQWVQRQIEPTQMKANLAIEEKQMILQQLNMSELLESFIHRKYTGQKRFSLEGAETLIPMLSILLDQAGSKGVEEVVLGMAHRGRLNVLANILKKAYHDIFAEFEEGYLPAGYEGSGDVKYHKGWISEIKTAGGHPMKVTLSPNPSHLESVDPVVLGQARARQVSSEDPFELLPILIHGDAALAGQGVVYETMQLTQLENYGTGGTVHFVINNQIGFTTHPEEGRSTRYCTDIAKAFRSPIFHVNAEDPEGCVYATQLAGQIRQRFQCDVFIELNCYRKYGHNETDEPAYTQPLQAKTIKKKKPIRELYRDQLIHEGVVEKYLAEGLEAEFKDALHAAVKRSRERAPSSKKGVAAEEEAKIDRAFFKAAATGVEEKTLLRITKRISKAPKSFNLNQKLAKLLEQRSNMILNQKPIDWGMAELLAYGTLLWEGTSIRLSGQDTRRGTFSHRHAVWVDQESEAIYSPLRHLKEGQGRWDVINTPLSEMAVLGFEYGYSLSAPESLVIWEAQFGDFANGAQVIIDQYLTTGEHKWGQTSRLTLLLPHGYEGMGPEHSSARMERFLSSAADGNIRLVNPSTPAQLFHLLRNQVKSGLVKPLVVFTPKELLRHPHCVSQVEELTEGHFQTVLFEEEKTEAKTVVFCSGHIFYDLLAEREKREVENVALVRIEQLYPLDTKVLKQVIAHYKKGKRFVWVQEEPENMGAWEFIQFRLHRLVPEEVEFEGITRPRSASPATGVGAYHRYEKEVIMEAVFREKESKEPFSIPRAFRA